MTRFSSMSTSKRIKVVLALILALTSVTCFMPMAVQAADGDLDATFGTGGVVRTNFGANHTSAVSALGIQSVGGNAGKIIAGGFDQGGAMGLVFALARYTTAGVLDTTFGSSGIVTTDFNTPTAPDRLNDLAITSTDEIVAVGTATVLGQNCGFSSDTPDFAIAVYTANGSLDTTFNTTGKKTIDFFMCIDIATAVLVQPADGKIVVVGEAFQDAGGGILNSFLALARLNPDGSLDNTFGGGTGKITFSETTNGMGTPNDIKLITSGPQAGKFIVVGGNTTTDFFVARFNSDGSLDNNAMTGFGPAHTGVVATSFSAATDIARSVVIQPDNKIIAAGVSNHTGIGTEDFAMARYNADGSLDGGFGAGGKVTTDFSGGGVNRNEQANFVGLNTNGKIVLVGMSVGDIDSPQNSVAIARYNGTDGSLDTSFGTSGKVLTHLGATVFPNPVGAHGGAIQSDAKILVGGGITGVMMAGVDFFVARFQNSSPDCTLTCPADITKSNDPNQCGAVVTFANPSETGTTCTGTIMCSPASMSFFPVGTTTVTCSDSSGPSCSFTVTVNDTQNPTITCPANIVVPGSTCQNVSYTTPTPSDNCPGATASCLPASGTCFAVGTTTVTCTAKDASNNMATCNFTVTVSNCAITCPANQIISTDPGATQCCALANFSPSTTGSCGKVTCNPPSGTCFPVGSTMVTCSAAGGPNCSFMVTVIDNTPPVINCPANKTAKTANINDPCVAVSFTTTASDNCPGVTVACVPPTGSCFPVGTSTVNCTATDASNNTAHCSFTVTVFNVCIQDDSNPGTVFLANATTGAYRFCCGGTTFTGVALVTRKGNVAAFQDNSGGRRVQASDDEGVFKGTASIQSPPGTIRCTITDRDTRNNSCLCQ